jgi:ferric-dicitrate binding protein FerR (iron transport regulator)
MTDQELIDLYLAGEIDEAGLARLEEAIAADPALLRDLADQQGIEQALRVLQGDGTDDQKVAVSVLAVLRGGPVESLKSDVLAAVKEEDLRRRKEEASNRVPIVPLPAVEPRARQQRRRRPVFRVEAAGLAAAAAIAAGILFLLPSTPGEPEGKGAFLMAADQARLQRGKESFAARADLRLEPGDRLTLAEGGSARIGFADDTARVEVKGPALLQFVRGGSSKRLELVRGEIEAEIPPQAGAPLRIQTPHAELSASEARLRLQSAADFSRLEVRKGAATFTRRSDSARAEVAAGLYAVASADVAFVARALEPEKGQAGPSVLARVLRVQGEAYLFTQAPSDRVPALPGQPVLETHGILTEGARSLLVLEYPDTTRLEIGPDTVVRRLADAKDRTRKHVALEAGGLHADVVRQPQGRPMTLATGQAEVRVLGTRFTLSSEGDATRVQVEEGAVQFTRARERETIVVRSGQVALAAPGRPFEAVAAPGGVRYLEVDLASPDKQGDGEWSVEGRAVRQARVSRLAHGVVPSALSSCLFRLQADEKVRDGSVLLEAVVEVDRVTPDGSPGLADWGFGLATVFGDEAIVLRTHQGGEGGSGFELDGGATAFEHGREGTYRIKLQVDRRPAAAAGEPRPPAVLRGKIWQGDLEPDGWMREVQRDLKAPLGQVGLQTLRCACTFSSFKVRVLKD